MKIPFYSPHPNNHLNNNNLRIIRGQNEDESRIHSMTGKLCQFMTDIRCCLVVGGLSTKVQEAALRSLPDIVVATPGRMIDHFRNSLSVHLDELAVLILD